MLRRPEKCRRPTEPQGKTYANLLAEKKANVPAVEKNTPGTIATAASVARNSSKESLGRRAYCVCYVLSV